MRISDWSSDVCSSDLRADIAGAQPARPLGVGDEHLRVGIGAVPIAAHDLRAGGDDLAGFALGGGAKRIVLVDQPDARAGDRLADRARFAVALIRIARDHARTFRQAVRSEEHTSELQSLMRISYAV